MAQYGPLVHRRRKQLSLDGAVPGIEYSRHRSDMHYTGVAHGRAGASFGRPPEEYDPVRSFYPSTPGYDQPEPEDAIAFEPRSPGLRFEPVPVPEPERIPCYEDGLAFLALYEDALEQFRTSLDRVPGPEQIPFDHDVRLNPLPLDGLDWQSIDTREPVSDALSVSYADQLAGSPGLMTEFASPLEQLFSEPNTLADPAVAPAATPEALTYDNAAMQDPGAAAPSLDELVAQLDHYPRAPELTPPDAINSQYDAFDQQMQQLMDPFGMPGPFG